MTFKLLFLSSTLFLVTCTAQTPTPRTTDNTSAPSVYTNPVSPNTQVADKNHGTETGLAICALSGIDGTLANGVATAYYFEDKGSIVGIQLNIAPAKSGAHYQAWLQNDAKKTVDLGTLANGGTDVRHSVRFDTKDDLRTYKNVLITLQTSVAETTPGQVIATGLLKDTKR